MGNHCSQGAELQFGQLKKVVEMDGDEVAPQYKCTYHC